LSFFPTRLLLRVLNFARRGYAGSVGNFKLPTEPQSSLKVSTIANASLGAELSMTTETADVAISSILPDIHDVPLTADVVIDPIEYALIMRSIVDDNSVTQVSAFNSNI
jgi:hypothetical protein